MAGAPGPLRVRQVGRVVAAVLCLTVVAGCSGEEPDGSGDAGATDGLEDFYSQTLDWGECEDRPGDAECARLTVPVDYAEPGGRTIELVLIRLTARGPDPVGSLVTNLGGPGIGLVDAPFFPPVAEQVQDAFDVVGFDPRGVGRSAGLSCLEPSERDALDGLDGTPDTPAEVAALSAGWTGQAAACDEASDGLLPYLGTEQGVQDLDVLRAALGEERLHYLGVSYGTLLGGEYAARFPDRVGRMVLDSPVPVGSSDPRRWLRDRALNSEAALDRALEYCLPQADCTLGTDLADARARLEAYLTELDERPVEVDGALLTRERALAGLDGGLGSGPDGYGSITRALAAAYTGAPVQLAGLADRDDIFTVDALTAVSCADAAWPTLPDDEAAAMAREWASEAPVFGSAYAWAAAKQCDGWPTASLVPAPRPADPEVELLLVNSTGDPFSPPADADLLAEELPGAVRLVYDGPEHHAYRWSPCVSDAVDAYLVDGTVPEVGTCPDRTGG